VELVDLKCPNCSAPLRIGRSATSTVCEYCGSSFSLQAGAASGVAVAAVARAADDTRRQLDGVSRAVDALRQVAKDLEETAGVFRR